MIAKRFFFYVTLLSLFSGVSYAALIETTIESSFIGRTSRGGVIQPSANFSTGVINSYGDVWKAHHVFDTSELVTAGANILSATLQINVGSFTSYRMETLTVGGYNGTYVYNDSFNSFRPCCSFNRGVFPTLSIGDFGSATLDPQLTATGDILSIDFNSDGILSLQKDIDNASSATVFGTRFGIPVYEQTNRFLSPTSSSLLVSYTTRALQSSSLVPAPATVALLGIGLLGAVGFRRRNT